MSSPSPSKKRMDSDLMKLLVILCFTLRISKYNVTFLEGMTQFIVRFIGPNEKLCNIFEHFLPQLLQYPNADDPLNSTAANLFLNHPDEYAKRVKEYVQKFASKEVVNGGHDEKESDSSDSESSMSSFSEDETRGMDI